MAVKVQRPEKLPVSYWLERPYYYLAGACPAPQYGFYLRHCALFGCDMPHDSLACM